MSGSHLSMTHLVVLRPAPLWRHGGGIGAQQAPVVAVGLTKRRLQPVHARLGGRDTQAQFSLGHRSCDIITLKTRLQFSLSLSPSLPLSNHLNRSPRLTTSKQIQLCLRLLKQQTLICNGFLQFISKHTFPWFCELKR